MAEQFGFLASSFDAEVAPVHAGAMRVALIRSRELRRWLEAPIRDALALQCLLPDRVLQIVVEGGLADAV